MSTNNTLFLRMLRKICLAGHGLSKVALYCSMALMMFWTPSIWAEEIILRLYDSKASTASVREALKPLISSPIESVTRLMVPETFLIRFGFIGNSNLETLLKSLESISWVQTVTLNHETTLNSTPFPDSLLQQFRIRAEGAHLAVKNKSPMVPDDTFFSVYQSRAFGNPTSVGEGPDLAFLWNLARQKDTRAVAIIDSGVLPTHPEIAARLLPGMDFVSLASTEKDLSVIPGGSMDSDGRDSNPSDPGDMPRTDKAICPGGQIKSSWHGTAVASVIAAETNNKQGIAGVDLDVKIIPIRATGQCGKGKLADLLDSLYWASAPIGTLPGYPALAAPVKTVFIGPSLSLKSSDQKTYERICTWLFDPILKLGDSRGIVYVAPAGNRSSTLEFPAVCERVLSVTTSTMTGQKADFANWGSMSVKKNQGDYVNLFIKGEEVAAAHNEGVKEPGNHNYYYGKGTSLSAALVAGAMSSLQNTFPEITPKQWRTLIRLSKPSFVSQPGSLCPNPFSEEGVVENTCSCTVSSCGVAFSIPAILNEITDDEGARKTLSKQK